MDPAAEDEGELTLAVVRLFSLDSRTSIARWLVVLACVLASLWCLIRLLRFVDGIPIIPVWTLAALLLGKLFVESVRRLHDCGQNAGVALAGMAGIGILLATASLRWSGHGADGIAWGALMFAIVATGVMFLRPGSAYANAYGPPAQGMASPVSSVSGGKAGVFVATGFGLVGLAAGLGVLAWQSALDSQRDARMERVATDPPPTSADIGTRSDDTPLDNENAATSDRIDALLIEGGVR